MANDQRLLSQQWLTKHLLPPVVHFSWKVIWVPSKQLVPQSLQQDAVLWHIPKEKNDYYCLWHHIPLYTQMPLHWVVSTFGLLQLETILSIRLFRSSILGMLNLCKTEQMVWKKKNWNMNRELHSCSSVYNYNNIGDSNIVSIGTVICTTCSWTGLAQTLTNTQMKPTMKPYPCFFNVKKNTGFDIATK